MNASSPSMAGAASTAGIKSHPAREYVRGIPATLSDIRAAFAEVGDLAAYLSPFVWRATLSDAVESAMADGYELGRERERRDEKRRRVAPAVGALFTTMREAHGLSLAAVSDLAEVDVSELERVEKGEAVASPTMERRLTKFYGEYAGRPSASA